ncbi:S-adenosyl-L-methionine-dependent methyltransferase [Xylariaceae sp. FL0662B]|nr:S-adenosyl-L-methionine-dependent methyltransferase [Xylariaceae sp. FL0662B]
MADSVMSAPNSTLEAAAEGTLDEDEFLLSNDYDDSTAPSWCSLSSSVARHSYENGRRYHYYRQGHYPFPNDDQEQSKEEFKHLLSLELFNGRLYFSPIGEYPQRILDFGTGIGSWAVEMAEKFPGAEVLGVDLSPIQPGFCPPNLRFHVDNIEEQWAYGPNYDLVHLRHMGYLLKEPLKLLTSTYENLKSGGWLEFQDIRPTIRCDDDTLPPDYAGCTFLDLIDQALTKVYGFDTDFVHRMPMELEKAGFINIRQIVYKVPVGTWTRDDKMRYIGWMLREALIYHLRSVGLKPLLSLGCCPGVSNNLISQVEEQSNDRTIHAYLEFAVVYGQKP